MKDYLMDIVHHTHNLNFIDLVKVTGTDSETTIDGLADDKSVIIQARFKNPVPEFIGTFGMPNLGKLKTILNLEDYRENADITVVKQIRNGEEILAGVHFENAAKDFKNDYRFMVSEVVNDKLKNVKFKGAKWGVDISPTVAGIMRMKAQASANSESTTFVARVENGNLVFYFGDPSSHSGNFVFQSNVSGSLTKAWNWPVTAVISILSLAGDKTFKISDDGAAMITVTSGVAEYNYILPAMQK